MVCKVVLATPLFRVGGRFALTTILAETGFGRYKTAGQRAGLSTHERTLLEHERADGGQGPDHDSNMSPQTSTRMGPACVSSMIAQRPHAARNARRRS